MGKPPACPSSLSRHPWRAQKLQLLQTAFRATVPAVRQGLHRGKKWPCPVTSSLTRTEAVFGQAMAAQPQWPQCRLCPLLSPPCPTLTCHRETFQAAAIATMAFQKSVPLVLFSLGKEYFKCPFPSFSFPQTFYTLATSHSPLEGSEQGCPELEMLLLQEMGYPLWKGQRAGSWLDSKKSQECPRPRRPGRPSLLPRLESSLSA